MSVTGRRRRVAWSITLFVALGVAGFVSIALGWRTAARTLVLSEQVPAVVSGGIGGLALVVIAAALLNALTSRLTAATDRRSDEEVLAATADLLEALRASKIR